MSVLPSSAPGTAAAGDRGLSAGLAAGLVLDKPVVVLTSARSGSTLLRFMLDAHPVLACPPETNLVKTSAQLAAAWRLLGGPVSPPGKPGAERPKEQLPEAAAAAIRGVLDALFAGYLTRLGKRRWCEKSLGTAEAAEAFLAIYPQAKFLCLYRHCMDVIASGLEACPWGVAGYGFDPYVGNHPGNNAAALAHYWADHTAATLQFEQAHPGACLRVHYETLVRDPEGTASAICAFLEVDQVPGIGSQCLAARHDPVGPADYKIWATTEVTAGSVGRGMRVPAAAIPAPLRAVANDLLSQLGYATVDEGWGTRGGQRDLLVRSADSTAAQEPGRPAGSPELDKLDELLASRVRSAFASGVPGVTESGSWPPGAPRQIVLSADAGHREALRRSWHIDLDQGTVSQADEDMCDGAALRISGDHQAWVSVLTGATNLGVAFRRGELRGIRTPAEGPPVQDRSLPMLASLLGLARC